MIRKFTLLFALFFLVKIVQSQIVITEIMYNPPESGTDSLEFIEIYNAGNNAVEMQGYILNFGNATRYTFTSSYSFASNSYLVFAVNASAVKNQYKLGFNPIQWISSGLGNSSGTIKLFDGSNTIVDSVFYTSATPWPGGSTLGLGASLNLCNYAADNSLAASWSASTTDVGTTINGQALKASPGAKEGCVLPVKWLSTTAAASSNSQVTISWQVAELFTQYYLIEKSTDAKSFVSVATISSKGDGVNTYSTSLFDNSATPTYYRIKQVDIDGNQTYSSTLQVAVNGKLEKAIQVYPNPATSNVVLTIDKAFVGANIQLTDIQGKVIKIINAAQASFSVDVSSLNSGIYYFKLPSQTPVKIIKQ